MVNLIIYNSSIGAHNVDSIMVEIPVGDTQKAVSMESTFIASSHLQISFHAVLLCLLLHFQALDLVQISAGGVDSTVVVGPEGTCELGQGPLLLISLPRHTEAFSACTEQAGGWNILTGKQQPCCHALSTKDFLYAKSNSIIWERTYWAPGGQPGQ